MKGVNQDVALQFQQLNKMLKSVRVFASRHHHHHHHHRQQASIRTEIKMASSPDIDSSRFGTGYLTDTEKFNKFIFTSDDITFDEDKGVGGARPVQGYNGPWPIFPETSSVTWSDVEASGEAGPSQILPSSSKKKAAPRMICKSTGRCSACPMKERHRPYCQPYGNRAPVECRPVTVLEVPNKPLQSSPQMPSKKIADKAKQASQIGSTESEMIDTGEKAVRMLPRQGEPVISSVVYKGYQTCGRDRVQEAWDYSEFIVGARGGDTKIRRRLTAALYSRA